MKKLISNLILFTLFFNGCRIRLESFDKQKITISNNVDSVLFKIYKQAILNGDIFLSLDSCRKTTYEMKQIKGPFFSDHLISIDKMKYSLNLSKASPIVFRDGYIYYPDRFYRFLYPKEKFDSLIVFKVSLGLPPCR